MNRTPAELARDIAIGLEVDTAESRRIALAALAELQAQAEAGRGYAEALEAIRSLPSDYDLLHNAQAKASYTYAVNALAAAAPPPAGQEEAHG